MQRMITRRRSGDARGLDEGPARTIRRSPCTPSGTLARIATGTAAVRWSQLVFGRTSSTTPTEQTPRNLFGFKDGTRNIAGNDAAALAQHVWVGAGDDRGARWMAGGSYLVARRIAMRIESWDRTSLREQEEITGRHKLTGAPLAGNAEHGAVDVGALPATSHVALAHPGQQRRAPDPAPWVLLRRWQRRLRSSRCRPVLHRLLPRSPHAIRALADSSRAVRRHG
jgi:hypothetical protein